MNIRRIKFRAAVVAIGLVVSQACYALNGSAGQAATQAPPPAPHEQEILQ